MEKPNNAFWILAGIGVLVICLAIALKVKNSSDASIDIAGISVDVKNVQDNLTAAQNSVNQASAEISSQQATIAQLTARIQEQQTLISQLNQGIQHSQVSSVLKSSSVKAFQQSSVPLPAISAGEPAVLREAQERLKTAQALQEEVRSKLSKR
jgi:peptidoglycan hydrolase CwlO-like protein